MQGARTLPAEHPTRAATTPSGGSARRRTMSEARAAAGAASPAEEGLPPAFLARALGELDFRHWPFEWRLSLLHWLLSQVSESSTGRAYEVALDRDAATIRKATKEATDRIAKLGRDFSAKYRSRKSAKHAAEDMEHAAAALSGSRSKGPKRGRSAAEEEDEDAETSLDLAAAFAIATEVEVAIRGYASSLAAPTTVSTLEDQQAKLRYSDAIRAAGPEGAGLRAEAAGVFAVLRQLRDRRTLLSGRPEPLGEDRTGRKFWSLSAIGQPFAAGGVVIVETPSERHPG